MKYEQSHPWITFTLRLDQPGHILWLNLGEAASKCEHIAGVALHPAIAQDLLGIYLAKGVNATTAIEGNTLTEQQVLQRITGDLKLPPSQEYLGQEVDNVIAACNMVAEEVLDKSSTDLTIEKIKRYNKMVLKNLPLELQVIPGELRDYSVLVGNQYRGAPWQDLEYLLGHFCEWMNGPTFRESRLPPTTLGIIKAIVAHVYLAWIHPFGDGNGRTARLIELQVQLAASMPQLSCQLLSNHYNATRSMYYLKLQESSRNGGDLVPFLEYASRGLVDELASQIEMIQTHQLELAWQNYVHEQFKDKETVADERRRKLVIDLSKEDGSVPVNKVRELTKRQAAAYAGKTERTVVRDLRFLEEMGLVEFLDNGKTVRARSEIIKAFLPKRWVRPQKSKLKRA
jgi:Fic family protein